MTDPRNHHAESRKVPRRALLQGLGVVAASATAGAVAASLIDDDQGSSTPVLPSDFVFGSTGDDESGGFADWEKLTQALAVAPPGEKWIVIEGEAVVPAGTWDIHGAGFRGQGAYGVGLSPDGHPDFLRFGDGARLENASRHLARDGIVLWSDSSDPVVVVDDERSYYFEDDAWVVSTDAAFFEVTATEGRLVLFSFRTGSGLVHASTTNLPGRTSESIDHTGSATLIVALAAGNNIFDDDTVKGNGVVIAAISSAAGIRYPESPRTGFTHRGCTSVMPLLFSAAENIGVQVAARDHWPESPSDVAHALDLLAARIVALEN